MNRFEVLFQSGLISSKQYFVDCSKPDICETVDIHSEVPRHVEMCVLLVRELADDDEEGLEKWKQEGRYQSEKGSKIKKTHIMRESAACCNASGSSSRIGTFNYTGISGPS